MKSVLFYWSRGAKTRCTMIKAVYECDKKNEPCYQNSIAEQLGITFVAVKKHLSILIEEGYIKIINPKGKPHYLKLTEKGEDIYLELTGR